MFVSATHVTEFNRYAIILKYFDELWTERLTLGHRKTFQNRFGLRSTHEFNSRHNKLVGPGDCRGLSYRQVGKSNCSLAGRIPIVSHIRRFLRHRALDFSQCTVYASYT